jgi:cystathionine beta-lyase/cystathionine gamma-synthase
MVFTSDEWICAHYGDDYSGQKGSVSTPIFQSSTHIFDTCEAMTARRGVKLPFESERTYFYGRQGNPTVEVLEAKIAALERADGAVCFASGMAAITSVAMYVLKSGDHAIVVDHSYGAHFLTGFLADYGIETTVVAGTSIDEFTDAVRPNTRLIYLESPAGMVYSLQDLSAVSALARAKGILTAIDNTWATPVHQKPHTFGIDLVIHSLSKYIGGHSDIIGGAVTGSWDHVRDLVRVRLQYGGILHPQEGYLALRGLRTLPVRMKLHQHNGMEVAEYLSRHPRIVMVNYPGLASHPQHELAKQQMLGYSSLMSMVMDAPAERSRAFVNNLRLFKIAVSWGGYESLIIEPRQDGDDPSRSSVRFYVGQDNLDDLLTDLDESLKLL